MSNIRNLFTLDPERREALRHFYADQASFFMKQIYDPAGGAAALSIAVTGESQIVTKLAAVDAVHASILLAELDKVRAQLLRHFPETKLESAELEFKVGLCPSNRANVVPIGKAGRSSPR